jgi:chromosome segregation ATPase
VSKDSEFIEELRASHDREVTTLKRCIAKLQKKLKQAVTSLEICQTAHVESSAGVDDLTSQLSHERALVGRLKTELSQEQQKQIDASALMKLALEEAGQFSQELETASLAIQKLGWEVQERDGEIQKLNEGFARYIRDSKSAKMDHEETVKESVGLHLRIDELEKQLEMEKSVAEEQSLHSQAQIHELEARIEKLQQLDENAEKSKLAVEKAAEKLKVQVKQQMRLRKAAELAKHGALTNLKNAYALVSSSESSRHEIHLEVEKLSADLDTKIQELQTANDRISKYEAEIQQLTTDLRAATAKNEKLEEEVDMLSAELQKLRENTVAKREAAETMERLEDDKARLISELDIARSQYQSLSNEIEARQETFRHQEGALVKAQTELRELARRNRILRKKLQSHGIGAGAGQENDDQPPECQSCISLKEQVAALQKKNSRIAGDLGAVQKLSNSMADRLSEFFEQLCEIGNILQNEALNQEITQVQQFLSAPNADLNGKFSVVCRFGLSVIENLIKNVKRRSGETTETRLLKSSIAQLENKVASLKSDNARKGEQIEELKRSLESSFKSRSLYESELEAMTNSLTTLKSELELTQKKLSESERSRTRLQRTRTVTKGEMQGGESEMSARVVRAERRANGTTLSDSLALLDLLCQ